MQEADYDLQDQYACLIFHLCNVVPRLGPSPERTMRNSEWKSFMTDDFSPLEYSWNWNALESHPTIRYSVEVASAKAGTAIDPYNRQPMIELCDQLRLNLSKADWKLFDTMRDAFYDPNTEPVIRTTKAASASSPSSLFLAFELGEQIATKAYFMPVKADQHKISRIAVLTQAIERMRENGYPCAGYEQLVQYMTTDQGSTLELVLVGIDCFESEESRFKVYLRSPRTSFASVCETMTLGSTLESRSGKARTNLRDLWRMTLDLDSDFSDADDLPNKRHQTSGALYNFDIKLRGSSLRPKLYIPIKHYATNDASAAYGLENYLRSRGEDAYFPNYLRALQSTSTHRSLEAHAGGQTYIGTGIRRDGSLALCSYINGEVYHPNRSHA
jgi:DMATS type aromatic prenyltransferase